MNREQMICVRCKSKNVTMLDSDTARCKDCGYILSVKVDSVTFKTGEPHFDSRKYTCDPSYMKYWEKRFNETKRRIMEKKIGIGLLIMAGVILLGLITKFPYSVWVVTDLFAIIVCGISGIKLINKK